nr:immunoglobulin heavy chain junction region [Mus musculus]
CAYYSNYVREFLSIYHHRLAGRTQEVDSVCA